MITIKVKRFKGLFEKTRGLMFINKITPVYFETRFGVHTFFLKKPIDVVILKEDGTIYEIRKNLRPWRIYLWNPKYFRVIELPNGFVRKEKISIQSKVTLI